MSSERSERWEQRMIALGVSDGPRAWLDEARQQRARRIAAEDRERRSATTLSKTSATATALRLQLQLSEQSEHDRGRYMAEEHNRLTEVRNLVWRSHIGCGGLRTEQCRDCDWGDGAVCLVDGKPLGEWGEES